MYWNNKRIYKYVKGLLKWSIISVLVIEIRLYFYFYVEVNIGIYLEICNF